jgi:hypothetical protein
MMRTATLAQHFEYDALIARPNGDVLAARSTWTASDAFSIPGWTLSLGAQRTSHPVRGDAYNKFDLLAAHAGGSARVSPGGGFRTLRTPDGVFFVRGEGAKTTGTPSDRHTFAIVRIPRPSPEPGAPPRAKPSSAASPVEEEPLLGPDGAPLRMEPRDVRLACEIEQTSDRIHVRFEIANASKEPIYLFDHRGRWDADFDILCDGGGGAVHALLGVPPLPPFPIPWRYQPKGSYLDPGSSVSRAIRAELPLDERNAYWPLGYRVGSKVEATRFTLRVDFLRASKIRDAQHPEEPRGDVDAVSCTVDLPRPVELRRRSDEQWHAEGTQDAFPLGRI